MLVGFGVQILGLARCGFFLGGLCLLGEEAVAIFLGDLIVIRVDFGKGQEAVAIAAIVDKRRLQRRFDPCDLG